MPEGPPHERERRFRVDPLRLLAGLERFAPGAVHDFRQGYLSVDPARIVRVRVARSATTAEFRRALSGQDVSVSAGPASAWLGLKGLTLPDGPVLVRPEWELPLDPDTALQLLDTLALQPVIHKLRAEFPADGLVWEVDVFLGRNRGLVLAEIELPAGAALPEPPDWLGPEIGDNPAFSNAALVHAPFDTWPPSA
jgi:adenylate cyclase